MGIPPSYLEVSKNENSKTTQIIVRLNQYNNNNNLKFQTYILYRDLNEAGCLSGIIEGVERQYFNILYIKAHTSEQELCSVKYIHHSDFNEPHLSDMY